MKLILSKLSLYVALFCGSVFAQEVQIPPTTTVAEIPEPANESAPPESPTPIEKPDFQIEGTQIKFIEVVEAPPLPGLPPVEGTMRLTVHAVADPGLPDPVAPVEITHPTPVDFNVTESTEDPQETHLIIVSATVYDQSRTLLTCQPMDGGGPSVTAWSNINFNHINGIDNFEATGADGLKRGYHLIMGIGNEDTRQIAQLAKAEGVEAELPQIPILPDGTPAFQIVTENPNPSVVKLIEDLHALYRDDKENLAAAAAAREAAYEEKKAHLLAHPPKPADVTVHFWKRDKSTANEEGGQP